MFLHVGGSEQHHRVVRGWPERRPVVVSSRRLSRCIPSIGAPARNWSITRRLISRMSAPLSIRALCQRRTRASVTHVDVRFAFGWALADGGDSSAVGGHEGDSGVVPAARGVHDGACSLVTLMCLATNHGRAADQRKLRRCTRVRGARTRVWVPGILHTSRDLLILVNQPPEPVASSEVGEVGPGGLGVVGRGLAESWWTPIPSPPRRPPA